MDDATERNEILERKYQRERLARMAAEKQLEEYSLQVYQSQISLQQSYQQAKKREAELRFLADLSAASGVVDNAQELVQKTVELSCSFLQGAAGYAVYVDGNCDYFDVDSKWHFEQQHPHNLTEHLPSIEDDLSDSWLVLPADELGLVFSGKEVKWLLYMNAPMFDGTRVAIVILLPFDYLDEENLYVMETARRHVVNGIRRCNNECQILKRSEQLQSTLNELEVAQKQLITSEKMASLGQLSAGIAHEINNPLSYVKSNLETLNEYLTDMWNWCEDMQRTVDANNQIDAAKFHQLFEQREVAFLKSDTGDIMSSVLNGITRVREIISDLKTFSHSAQVSFEPLSIEECLDGALKIAWNSLKYDFTVKTQIDKELPSVTGNISQLQQVFVNLFVNAGQAMTKSGTLTITATRHNEQQLLVSVADTGCGMNEETLGKLFTPFFTTKPVGVGTGLGLSVSYGIINNHKATIDVQSVEGEGTTFKLYFPIVTTR